MPGRKITIFLVDGTSTGVRVAQLGLSTIRAIVIPRVSLSASKLRKEVQRTGVYILVGPNPESDKPEQKRIYIGETDTIIDRLVQHDKDAGKDFWEEAVSFVADENLTKSQVRYLEARLIRIANEAKQAVVANGTSPSEEGMLPEADATEMEEFVVQARLLLRTLGFNMLDAIQTPSTAQAVQSEITGQLPPIFRYSGQNFDATCLVDIDAGQFIVKQGSKARKHEAPTLLLTYKALRGELIQKGVLADFDEGSYVFAQDSAFSAATPAAQVVSGIPINGRTAWKTESGDKTFGEWQDVQFPQESTS